MKIADLVAYVRANVTDFAKNMSAAEGRLSRFASQAQSTGATLSSAFTLPLVALGKQAFDAAVKFDSLNRSLTLITGSSNEASRQLVQLQDLARMPGLGFEEAVAGARNLEILGVSFKNAKAILAATAIGVARGGGGKADFEAVMINWRQLLTSGKLAADEFRETAARIPELGKAIKGAFGTMDTEKLAKMGVTAKQIVGAVTEYFLKLKSDANSLQNRMDNLSDTVQGAFRSLGASVAQAVLPVFEKMAGVVQGLTAVFNKFSPQVRLAIVVTAGLAAAIPPLLIAFGALASAVSAVMAVLASPFVIVAAKVIAVIGAIALAVYALREAWSRDFLGIRTFTEAVISDIVGMFNVLKEKFDWLQDAVTGLKVILGESFKFGLDTLTFGQGQKLIDGTANGIDLLKNKWEEYSKVFSDAFKAKPFEMPKFDKDAFLKGDEFKTDAAAEKLKKLAEAYKQLAQQRLAFVHGLEKGLFDLEHTGKVAEVIWERTNGILKGANPALVQYAVYLAQMHDWTERLNERNKRAGDLFDNLNEKIHLTSAATEAQRLNWRLFHGDLMDLPAPLKIAAQAWQKLADDAEKATQSYKLFKDVAKDFEKTIRLGTGSPNERQEFFDRLGFGDLKDLGQELKDELTDLFNQQWNIKQTEGAMKMLGQGLRALGSAANENDKKIQSVFDAIDNGLQGLMREQTVQFLGAQAQAWEEFFSGFREAYDNLPAFGKASVLSDLMDAFANFQDNAAQLRAMQGFVKFMGDVNKQASELAANGAFEKFKASLTEVMDLGEGNFALFQPYSDQQLKQMFQAQQWTNKLQEQADLIHGIADGLRGVFTQAFEDLSRGFGGFFDSIVTSFRQMLVRMAAEWLANQLVQMMMGLVGNLFAPKVGNGLLPNLGTPLAGARAAGGMVSSGRAYLVGEQGVEVFVPHQSGRVVPNSELAGAGGINITMHVHGVTDAASFRRSEGQVISELAQKIALHQKRNGGR